MEKLRTPMMYRLAPIGFVAGVACAFAATGPAPSPEPHDAPAADAAEKAAPPAIADLTVERDTTNWTASLRLAGGLTPDLKERIEAGLETVIEYRLYVCRHRSFLPDQVLVKRRLECSVRYEALTHQYTLTRRLDGELQETRVAGERDAMVDFMTVLRHVPLLPVADRAAGEEYYVKAKSGFGLVWRFYLIPWQNDTDWAKTPLPPAEGEALATRP